MYKSKKIKKPFVCTHEDIKQIIHRLTASQEVKYLFSMNPKSRIHDRILDIHIQYMCFVIHCLKNEYNNWLEITYITYTYDNFKRDFYINNEDMEYIRKLVTTHFTRKL